MASARRPSPSPPSSPLSVLSQSPPPPSPFMDFSSRYPSPSSSASTSSGNASPLKTSDLSDTMGEIQVRTDGPPPSKRRRIAPAPKERRTEHIDLEHCSEDQQPELVRFLSALRSKKRIVVIAGAGISVSAGIPDFRSSTGLFASLRGQHKLKASGKHLFDASVYKHDSSTTSFHTMVRQLAQMTDNAKPTPFHHMLASIAQEGRLLRLYTQNIDTLETQMPPLTTRVPLNTKGPWPTTIQLHGGLEKMVCSKCNNLQPFNAALFDGPEAPLCEKCKETDEVRTTHAGKRSHGIGRLRPRIVLYNEYNPDEEAIGNVSKADMRKVPDAVIVVGTTLKIPGVRRLVKELCQLTRSRRGGITAWLNIDPEPPGVEFKDCWDFVIKGKCDDVAELVNLPHWDQQDIGDSQSYMVTGNEENEKRLADAINRDRIDVILERKRKRTASDDESSVSSSQGPIMAQTPAHRKAKLVEKGSMPTPIASPKVRHVLPTGRPPGSKNKPKQSTLLFGNGKDKPPKAVPVPPTKKVAAKRKTRQPKKEPSQAKNTVNMVFRATKTATARSETKAAALKEQMVTLTPVKQQLPADDSDSSGLSSPMDLPADFDDLLPSLRPKERAVRRPTPIMVQTNDDPCAFTSSTPTTPVTTTVPRPVVTISPSSKPRCMGHLIE
ncbi:DHS-like NAD/FAD-binding domain-containing protein [Podospora fimiseda]|uniref:DHS-like NAD/FAD-binding domain-containing protein n=1 Tax=Podospora fimiseda TaxID=252190 RepID=A0AAN7BZ25_9PEZI|nr:DHS-like NAD/FAD-binding domain-containing protein [Podospora fimiseda]